jgi:hypothetical protein
MNLPMVHTPDDQRFLYEDEVTSPELALVDPELAERARARLPNPGESEALARIASQLQRQPAAERALEPEAESGWAPRRASRRWAVPLAVGASLVAVFLLTDLRVEFGRTPAAADTSALEEPEPTDPTPTAPAAQEPTGPASTTTVETPAPGPAPSRPRTRTRVRQKPQRFAWAPTANAGGYHIELFRGQVKVFATDTERPAVTVPVRWTFASRSRTLSAGEYRWYVWPVIGGRQAGRAIVQARLTVPAR